MRYGHWTILKESERDKAGRKHFLAKCDCGNEKIVRFDHLKSGRSTCCGCVGDRKMKGNKNGLIHGGSYTRLYTIWQGMKTRCYSGTHVHKKYYYDKGIIICEQWHDFENFRNWALENGYKENLTIDRIDSNGNYEPFNCQWITQSENSRRVHIK